MHVRVVGTACSAQGEGGGPHASFADVLRSTCCGGSYQQRHNELVGLRTMDVL